MNYGPLTALDGYDSFAVDGRDDAGRLWSQGTTADPSHGQWGDTSAPPEYGPPFPSHGQAAYPPEDWGVVGEAPPGLPPGPGDQPADRTPASVTAPYPRLRPADSELRNPEAQWEAQEASVLLHGEDLGGDGPVTYGARPEDGGTWDVRYEVSAGQSLLQQVPPQLRGQGTGHDVAQGWGTAEGYGYAEGHLQRYDQIDPVPGNYQWLTPGERPFRIKTPGVQNSYDGPDSPYGASGDTTQAMMQGSAGAAVEGFATPYAPPADPVVLPVMAGGAGEAPVWSPGW